MIFRVLFFNVASVYFCFLGVGNGQTADSIGNGNKSALYGITITDTQSQMVYCVENDQKHVVAKNNEGQIVWRVCPYSDPSMLFIRARPGYQEDGKPMEFITPRIIIFNFITSERWKLYKREGYADDFIEIGFKPNQGGLIRKKDGKFFYLGSN